MAMMWRQEAANFMERHKNLLILGAGGFIGAHLTERALTDGYRVTAVDTHADKIRELLGHEALSYVDADIRDPGLELDALVREADVVIDLIAYANPGMYVKMPLEVFRLNFNENMRIAEACVRHQKRLIQFSSCEVYGKTAVASLGDRLPDPEDPFYATFSEDTSDLVMGPVSKHRWIYACSKQLLERVLHAYGLEGRLNYTIIRPFNFIGPKIDYLPADTDGMPRVFSYFMEALLQGRPMKLVNGGSHRRCYTYIEDAIDCLARILENPGAVCDRQIFNVGSTDNEVTIRALAEKMRALYDAKYRLPGQELAPMVEVSGETFYGDGYEDSDRRIPDNRKARTLLGWAPRWGLDELLEITMAYYIKEYPRVMAEDGRAGACEPSGLAS